LMCSYWRSRLSLHACCGIATSSARSSARPYPRQPVAEPSVAQCSYSRPMIDPVLAFNHGVAHRLSLALATLVAAETLTSESDVPFEPFTAAFEVGTKVTSPTFKAALGFDPSRHAVLGPASTFFANAAAATDDPGTQQVFAVLERVMRRSLSGLAQVFVRGDGIVEVPFFLFGRLAGGPLVGLRSTAVET
jgi:hypothetical protein